jgi:hypothetical protein
MELSSTKTRADLFTEDRLGWDAIVNTAAWHSHKNELLLGAPAELAMAATTCYAALTAFTSPTVADGEQKTTARLIAAASGFVSVELLGWSRGGAIGSDVVDRLFGLVADAERAAEDARSAQEEEDRQRRARRTEIRRIRLALALVQTDRVLRRWTRRPRRSPTPSR